MSDDLISRQEAIDIVNDLRDCIRVDGYWAWVERLKKLPSAQLEQQWIPCSVRLPKDGTWNIFTDGESVSVERYKEDAIDHFFPCGRWFEFDDAVAWMPLPEPYKEENQWQN